MVPEGWSEYSIGDIASIQVGRDLKEDRYSDEKTETHIYPVYSNTVDNLGLYGFYDFEEYTDHSVTIVGRGAGLGTAFSRRTGFGAIGRLLVASPINKSFDVDYLANYINFSLTIHHESGGIPQLPGATFAKYKVLLPPISEQTKIAQILSTWDKAITTTERLLANSQQQKQALMQQLLTGKVRFPDAEGEWHEVEIGNIIKEVKRPVVWDDDVQYRLLSVKRRAEGVVLREVLAGSQILTKKMNTARAGDFLISKMQVTHGAMGLVTDEFDNHHISDSYIAVIAKDPTKLDINFFSWLGRTKALWRLAFLSSYGVHIEKLTFNFSLFLKEKINIPSSLAEQQKIAQVLSTADAEITNLQAQLAKLKLEKKALMQQLLTGQRRVRLDDEVEEELQIRRVG
ncbi:restriction endonuclease subunit S [Pseudomonas sp. 1928-m]|uniref:restriction endonuclease subunit S n=1 Tax=Pseudomonas sp. 1928-m TaxID=3033804 RepID=UPI0023DE811A|nr:restriction endonuclease subunit S [Pseudomonas sp. 1928-m]MDF3195482.1 restriction endonuclease subunit S [Pseudomonas sp. 1928-m]